MSFFLVRRLCPAALLLCSVAMTAQTRRALLIGIDLFQPPGTRPAAVSGCKGGRCDLPQFPNLHGSVNDARSMADVLTSPKFGFPAANVVLLTNPADTRARSGVVKLPASQTTRDGILAAMRKYLVDVPQAGDTVVFYDAGHGSLRLNSKGTKQTVLVNGKYVPVDSTLVPADAYKGGYDVRDREMTRIFNAALDKGVHLTVLLDTCHSGAVTRGPTDIVTRSLPFDPRDIAEAPDAGGTVSPTERAVNPALVFAAVRQDQKAREFQASPKEEIHGAFTSALVQALQAMPADAPVGLIAQRVKAVLDGEGICCEDPELDASAARREQPIFGVGVGVEGGVEGGASSSGDGPGNVVTAVLSDDDGTNVPLDIGSASGIGVGSEFTSFGAAAGSAMVTLRVTALNGLARSSAQVVGAAAPVKAGDLFARSLWVPPVAAGLPVWMGASNLSSAAVLAAASQVKASGVALIDDPAEQAWTDRLTWSGTSWLLQHEGGAPRSAPSDLGTEFTAAALKQHLGAGARLWASLPAPAELVSALALDATLSVRMAADQNTAKYVLAGVLGGSGAAYGWFDEAVLSGGPITATTARHSPGCSATSQYPVRSDWVPLDSPTEAPVAVTLRQEVGVLAKVHGWLTLAHTPVGASTTDYYSLKAVRPADAPAFADDMPLTEGDKIGFALYTPASSKKVASPRWVYLLDIDCHGKGSLIYRSESTLPNLGASVADRGDQLLGTFVPLSAPFGVETVIMLATQSELANPFVLDFDGAAHRSAAAESPLEQLFHGTSAGTRSAHDPVPSDWSLQMLTFRGVPGAGSPVVAKP